MPPSLPLRPTRPHPWSPLTDAEWSLLEPELRAPTGRPGSLRKVWDAIFWVACSRGPWRELPAELGRPDTAHRALRRAARSGALRRLLMRVSDHPAHGGAATLRWRVARAYRRVARLLDMRHLLLALRLGVRDALPCEPYQLPKPGLIRSIMAQLPLLPLAPRLPTLMPYIRTLFRAAVGQRRAWRLTA